MAIQPQTFLTRVRDHSELSPRALFVAVTIAEVRFRRRRKPHEPLQLTLVELAQMCHMSRATVVRHLAECVESGWIVTKSVYRDGQQQASEYTLADPTETGTKPAPRRRRGKPMTAEDKARLADLQSLNRETQLSLNRETQQQQQNGETRWLTVERKVATVEPPLDVVLTSGEGDAATQAAGVRDAQDVHTNPRRPPEPSATDTDPAPATEAQRRAAQRELHAAVARARRSRWGQRDWKDDRTPEQRAAAATAVAALLGNGADERDAAYLAAQAADDRAALVAAKSAATA